MNTMLLEMLLEQWDNANEELKELMKNKMIEKGHWNNFSVNLELRDNDEEYFITMGMSWGNENE